MNEDGGLEPVTEDGEDASSMTYNIETESASDQNKSQISGKTFGAT